MYEFQHRSTQDDYFGFLLDQFTWWRDRKKDMRQLRLDACSYLLDLEYAALVARGVFTEDQAARYKQKAMRANIAYYDRIEARKIDWDSLE